MARKLVRCPIRFVLSCLARCLDGRTAMEQRTNHIRRIADEPTEQRSLTTTFLNGVAGGAGGAVGVGLVQQGKHIAGKVVDKIKAKDKD